MKPVIVRGRKIGEGIPKICIPIVEKTKEAILEAAKDICSLPADVVEWRADWYEDVEDTEKVLETAEALRRVLSDLPFLFTFRTAKEGGEREISPEDYEKLNLSLIQSGFIDLVDVEAFTGEDLVKYLIAVAHETGVKVVASNHDFEKTPEKEEILRRLIYMKNLGADLPKIAVMPQNRQDVLTLLAATAEMNEQNPGTPVITMSMARHGIISRLSGEVFGSALTFGAAGKVSAPGQIGAEELSKVLDILHKNIK